MTSESIAGKGARGPGRTRQGDHDLCDYCAARGPAKGRRQILERDEELSVIDGALRGARSGRGSLLLIEGSAGIGKTTLLAAACERAEAAGMRVLRASAYELEREPLGVAMALLGPLASGDAEPSAADDLFGVIEAMFWRCSSAAEESPLLLAIDDLHWVDAGTLALVMRIGREIGELPICLAAGLRTGEPQSSTLRESLLSGAEARRLAPRPLSAEATRIIARDRLGAGVEESVHASISSACGGNPFLLGELLSDLVDRGLGTDAAAADQVGQITPRSVSRFASERLERCSRAARDLALALAVLGRVDDERLALAAAGLAGADGARAMAELEDLDLIGEPGLAIRHPLLGRAVVESAGLARVRKARLRAARALADGGARARAAAQLIASGDRTALDREEWAVPSLIAAGSQAAARGDRSEAVGFLDHALEADLDDRARMEVLRERGTIRAAGRDPGAIDDLEGAARLSGDPIERGQIALALARARFYLVRLEEAAEGARRAIAEIDGSDRELRLMLEAEALNGDRLRGAVRRRPWELLDEVAAASTPAERAALAHVAAEAVATGERPVEEVAGLALRAWGDGALIDEAGAEAPVVSFLGTTLSWCEEFDRTLELTDAQLAAGRRRHSPVTVSYALALRGGTRLRMGDLAQAEADAEQVVGSLPASDPLAHMISLGWLLEALVARGRSQEATARLEASGLVGELPDLGTVDFLLLSRGDTRLAAGDRRRALDDYLTVGERANRSGYVNPAGMAWRSRAAAALLELGEREHARELASEESSLARRFGAPAAIGIALRALAACSQLDERVELLAEAARLLERSPARLQRARVFHDLGRALLDRGDRDGAAQRLERAMHDAHRCGAEPLVGAAMDGLRAAGRRPRRPAVRGVDALTAQQLRVAQLAASGRSNPEIAADLFLTRRTVELHLTGAYRKLEIGSREQLASALGDHDR